MSAYHARRSGGGVLPCCYRDDYGDVFRPEEAAAQARRFRRRGLTGTSRELVAMLRDEGVAGAEVLEVGAGVGDVVVALFRLGARRAVDVDLSPGWVEAARRFVAQEGFGDRFDARCGDIVDEAETLASADVVVLDRVVCCYPEWRALLVAAAGRSRRLLALVYPANRWPNAVALAIANLWYRLRGLRFRVFLHDEVAMRDALAGAGFEIVRERSGFVWRSAVLRRIRDAVPEAAAETARRAAPLSSRPAGS